MVTFRYGTCGAPATPAQQHYTDFHAQPAAQRHGGAQ